MHELTLGLPAFVGALLLSVAAADAQTPEGTLLFNNDSDTIAIDGQTELSTASTYEAWILFDGLAQEGLLYNEWTSGLEDKALGIGPTRFSGFNFGTGGAILVYSGTTSSDEWHHFAFVHDGAQSQERLYVDGSVVASQPISGDIGNGPGGGFIGAIFRDQQLDGAFLGFVDSVRLSNTARYSGDTFTVPPRDMPPDADAILVYHFAKQDFFQEDGKTRVTDRSGSDRHGTIGVGFAAATAPAAPARQGDADCNGSLTATDALLVLHAAVGSQVVQHEPCPDLGEVLTTGIFGDVDCNASLTATDALKVLQVAVGLGATQHEPCVDFLEPV